MYFDALSGFFWYCDQVIFFREEGVLCVGFAFNFDVSGVVVFDGELCVDAEVWVVLYFWVVCSEWGVGLWGVFWLCWVWCGW